MFFLNRDVVVIHSHERLEIYNNKVCIRLRLNDRHTTHPHSVDHQCRCRFAEADRIGSARQRPGSRNCFAFVSFNHSHPRSRVPKWLSRRNSLYSLRRKLHRWLILSTFSDTQTFGHEQHRVPLDHSTCIEWSRLWSSFGFSEQQWSSRSAKVEEHTRVRCR